MHTFSHTDLEIDSVKTETLFCQYEITNLGKTFQSKDLTEV